VAFRDLLHISSVPSHPVGPDGVVLGTSGAGTEHAVVLSDIGLPDTDGYGLIGELRALDVPGAQTAIAVALTGRARARNRRAALEAGVQGHVARPFDPMRLVGLLVQSPRPALVGGTGTVRP
jgi:CheY-like chemotaxis protein